jgi:arabinose-5-phosphate isomerase
VAAAAALTPVTPTAIVTGRRRHHLQASGSTPQEPGRRGADRPVDDPGSAGPAAGREQKVDPSMAVSRIAQGRPESEAGDSAAASALASARRVLQAEAEALHALARELDGGFLQAIERLAATRGRVVVAGMGKSGHIARKIAATFASTGTPALFVHPAEASHGDLGMVTGADSLLALSNSGETPELAHLLTYSRRFAIPLVAIVGKVPSTLADAADIVLRLPDRPEACPMGLAPTTSTTAMLALGDALAVALLERRGFSAHDFAVFHPGGKLGSRLVRVDQIMHQGADLPLVGPEVSVAMAVLEMTAKRLGCIGVVDRAGRLTGIVTDGDLRRHMGPDLLGRAIGELMTRDPKTIRPQALAAEAVAMMNDKGITVLFAVEDGRPVGALHLHDCLRAGVA